ncbi:urea transporter [Tautonia plasticadhaerens]|uniref:Urea transporter n=1 Tax=Tautonia plasticadhaerens TaxID=2527974 RepID=A0A518GVI3_9BACT|nr:urea transporter [Tautonia plasticadhaerens]QDV32602.1 Urea transporter [Tautonia plasticadhaerens]
MSTLDRHALSRYSAAVPAPVLEVLRGIGQVFFQENALTGACFALGIALSSPPMAVGAVIGSAIGWATARVLRFDPAGVSAGSFGFNSALVGIATLFFFRPGALSVVLLAVGCVVAAWVTRVVRRSVPFPTYTGPFIVTTWAVFFLGKAMGVEPAGPGYGPLVPNLAVGAGLEAIFHGIGQVMFQASLWTGILFLVGIALNDRGHAGWVLVASILGMLVAGYHVDAAMRALDPEQLVERDQFETIRLGLFGYNATLAAVALSLWRRSLIPPLLGLLLSVPLTEFIPRLGLPALTAPFVLATWIVLALGWLDARVLRGSGGPATEA